MLGSLFLSACPPLRIPPPFSSPLPMQPHLLRLNALYGSNVCGEGGEYESLVLDCPGLFKHGRIVLDDTEVRGAGCGLQSRGLVVRECSAVYCLGASNCTAWGLSSRPLHRAPSSSASLTSPCNTLI